MNTYENSEANQHIAQAKALLKQAAESFQKAKQLIDENPPYGGGIGEFYEPDEFKSLQLNAFESLDQSLERIEITLRNGQLDLTEEEE